MSGTKLRDISHKTEPWIVARNGLKNDENSNETITNKSIKEYAKTLEKESANTNEFCQNYMKNLIFSDND